MRSWVFRSRQELGAEVWASKQQDSVEIREMGSAVPKHARNGGDPQGQASVSKQKKVSRERIGRLSPRVIFSLHLLSGPLEQGRNVPPASS